ncbi:Swt1 family HEPN domain-containing protein [Bizionia sp.]|uniref:Swt1 family HEPN domain-containing protein n=1 Tax=Bizionia sp. TaxID=1954480 RepID=UPI003A8F35D4
MEEKFRKWVTEKEHKAAGTVYSYTNAIKKISEHYSQFQGKRICIFEIEDEQEISSLIELYDFNGKYSEFGNKGNRTYINGLKTYRRFLSDKPKARGTSTYSGSRNSSLRSESRNTLLDHFEQELKVEAFEMRNSYELFFCLERSIRDLVKSTMFNIYGEGWWSKVEHRVRENVKNNLEYEFDTTHTKRSENKIDYTTFGDLRKIINSNWDIFDSKFERNLNSVNEVMIDLNRIRVSIAHCTPLVDKEIQRLEIRIDDWFDLLK